MQSHSACKKLMKLNPVWKLLLLWHFSQGSTLGPLSFLLYIHDLSDSSTNLSLRIFADDTNIFFTSNNAKEVKSTINDESKLILEYCDNNKLSANL